MVWYLCALLYFRVSRQCLLEPTRKDVKRLVPCRLHRAKVHRESHCRQWTPWLSEWCSWTCRETSQLTSPHFCGSICLGLKILIRVLWESPCHRSLRSWLRRWFICTRLCSAWMQAVECSRYQDEGESFSNTTKLTHADLRRVFLQEHTFHGIQISSSLRTLALVFSF